MTIAIKRPYTDIKFIEVKSTKLVDLENELECKFSLVQLGRGLILLTQTYTFYDEPNFLIQDIAVYGTAYIIKAGLNRLIDFSDEDLNDIESMITFSSEIQ